MCTTNTCGFLCITLYTNNYSFEHIFSKKAKKDKIIIHMVMHPEQQMYKDFLTGTYIFDWELQRHDYFIILCTKKNPSTFSHLYMCIKINNTYES